MKTFYFAIALLSSFALPAFATVVVSSPSNGATVGTSVHYAATATTNTCSKGVASMGVYVDNQLLYVVDATTLNTSLSVNTGTHNTVVEEWDYCGGATFVSMTIVVNSQPGVHVMSPANNSTVSTPANYVASATSSCSKGRSVHGNLREQSACVCCEWSEFEYAVVIRCGNPAHGRGRVGPLWWSYLYTCQRHSPE